MKFPYHCKFCGTAGEVEYNEPGVLTQTQIVFWLDFVSCNPCAEYQRQRTDTLRAFYKAAGTWDLLKKTGNIDDVATARARKMFDQLIHKLCDIVETRWHLPARFESSLVETLLDHPGRVNEVTRFIFKNAGVNTPPKPQPQPL
jgi:hypothetical protein